MPPAQRVALGEEHLEIFGEPGILGAEGVEPGRPRAVVHVHRAIEIRTDDLPAVLVEAGEAAADRAMRVLRLARAQESGRPSRSAPWR